MDFISIFKGVNWSRRFCLSDKMYIMTLSTPMYVCRCVILWCCQDCHPATPCFVCCQPAIHNGGRGGTVGWDKGGLVWGESEQHIMRSHETCQQFQDHTMECSTIQAGKPEIIIQTICLNPIGHLERDVGSKGKVNHMVWVQKPQIRLCFSITTWL